MRTLRNLNFHILLMGGQKYVHFGKLFCSYLWKYLPTKGLKKLFTRIPMIWSFRNVEVNAVVVNSISSGSGNKNRNSNNTDSSNRKINNEITWINKSWFFPHVLMKVSNIVLPDQRQDFRCKNVMKSQILKMCL